LPTADLPALFTALAVGTPTALGAVPGINPTVIAAVGDAVKVAYSQAFKTIYLTSIAFGGLAIIAALFITSVDGLLTDFVARKIRGVGTKHVDPVDSKDAKKSITATSHNEAQIDDVKSG